MTFWAVKFQSFRSLCSSDPPLKFNIKISSFVFRRWTKVLRGWYSMGS